MCDSSSERLLSLCSNAEEAYDILSLPEIEQSYAKVTNYLRVYTSLFSSVTSQTVWIAHLQEPALQGRGAIQCSGVESSLKGFLQIE